MLNKTSNLLNIDGLIIYMVCSFLDHETEYQISNFLSNHSDFKIFNFDLLTQNIQYAKLINNKFMKTLPDTLQNHNIDGYFAAYLKKIK